jgi:hypothetical protein
MFPLWTYAATAILAGSLAFGGAWKVQGWRFQAKETARVEQELENKRQREKAMSAASTNFEAKREQVRVRTVVREKIVREYVDRPVYLNACLDDDGLNLINQRLEAK